MNSPAETLDIHAQAKGSSFHKAMLLLPKTKRKALLTLYALCREMDDAVDDAPDAATARRQLATWRAELNAVFDGTPPSHPLAIEFAALHVHYDFLRADMDAMLDALQMDAEECMRHPSEAELERYCYGVAGAVGLMSMQIFGCKQAEARPFAIALGHALQLTNILRDVSVDAEMGRIYLPQGIAPAQLAAKARAYFAEADTLAPALPTRNIAPALAMRDVYALYWKKLEATDWQPAENGKIPVSKPTKAHLAARASGYLLGRYKPSELF